LIFFDLMLSPATDFFATVELISSNYSAFKGWKFFVIS